MGGHAPHDQNDASDTRFVACPGKAEGRNEAERPPALQAPPQPHKRGARRTDRPPPQPASRQTNATDPPHGGRTAPSQVGGRPGAHAVGPVLGPHARTDRTWDTRVAKPWLPAPEDGRPGEGQRLTPDAPHNSGRPPPPGTAPPPPPRHAAPTGRAGQGDSVGPPHPHARVYSTWVADPDSPPSGRAVGGGGAPDPRRPMQNWKAPPPGTHFPHPHSPKPSRGEPGPDRPPRSMPDGVRDRGRTRGGARTRWNGPTSAECRDRTRCARHTIQGGGGADAAGARAHTHTKGKRGLPEGQPDQARRTHRQHGMAYQ